MERADLIVSSIDDEDDAELLFSTDIVIINMNYSYYFSGACK